MDIWYRKSGRKWLAEVWTYDPDDTGFQTGFKEPYPEDVSVELNNWCKDTFGYHARTAYHVFEIKHQKDLEFFILKWG